MYGLIPTVNGILIGVLKTRPRFFGLFVLPIISANVASASSWTTTLRAKIDQYAFQNRIAYPVKREIATVIHVKMKIWSTFTEKPSFSWGIISNLNNLIMVGKITSERMYIVPGNSIAKDIRKMLKNNSSANGTTENLMGYLNFRISKLNKTKALNHSTLIKKVYGEM